MALTPPQQLFSTAASIAAVSVLARTVVNDLLPPTVRHHIFSFLSGRFGWYTSKITVTIEEFHEGLFSNDVYKAAEIYLATRVSPSTRNLRAFKREGEANIAVSVDRGEEIVDIFNGVELRWRVVYEETDKEGNRNSRSGRASRHGIYDTPPSSSSEKRFFKLEFEKKHKQMVFDDYLPYVLARSKEIKEGEKTLKIHSARYERLYHGNVADVWTAMNLDHPSTFTTLAMESEKKTELMEDLQRFVRRKDYYRKVGKAWKRGYLLYGPPGTGKSSLIAAMANYLRFDIYDLELSQIQGNSILRSVLLATANRSILVLEDIDCAVELNDREEEDHRMFINQYALKTEKITLSGLLNFIDGLWSSCGDERIIVFTTNHKEKLDPALLRPGRMDMHIHMGYCNAEGIRTLLMNYHGVESTHPMSLEIEEMVKEIDATPAEVAEELLKSDDAQTALNGLADFLGRKKKAIVSAGAGKEGGGVKNFEFENGVCVSGEGTNKF